MKRVYIAGKVSGEEYEKCVAKFTDAADRLKSSGMIPVNPMNFVPKDMDWKGAMKLCIRSLVTCDYMLLLDDWKESKGAKLERSLAVVLGIPIINIH